MAQVYIKSQKPSVEVKVQADGSKDFILVGIRVYKNSELDKIRKEFTDTTKQIKIARYEKQLAALFEDDSLTDTEIEEKVAELNEKIHTTLNEQRDWFLNFYKEQILYIKNATLTIEEAGEVKDLVIADTREAKPIESLWATPDECLAALLGMYLDEPAFRDSLQKSITEAVFNTNFGEAKTKNLK